jgi:hypothetical protein
MTDWMEHNSTASMGTDMADINNDGYPDVFTTEMLPDDEYRLKTTTSFDNIDVYRLKVNSGFHHQFMHNSLQLNNQHGAFQEVSNALHALDIAAQTLKSAATVEKNAAFSLDLVRQQYQLGTVNYLALLNAQTQYQQARINLIQSQAERFSSTAALYAALGGGWWNRDGPAYQSTLHK